MRAKGLERRDKVQAKVMRNDGYRMRDVGCGNSTSTVGNMIFLQYIPVDFSLGLQENYILRWTFAVNFKKLNIFIKCFAKFPSNFAKISPKFQFRVLRIFRETEGKFRETRN